MFFLSVIWRSTIYSLPLYKSAQTMYHDVFISYSSKNATTAQAICHELEDNHIKCWMAPRDIPVGAKYASVISKAIKDCKVVVLVFSEQSAISPWVESEINIAFSNRKPIVPYKIDTANLENYDEFYLMLNNRHWIKAYPDFKTRFTELVSVVSTLVGVVPDPKDTKQPTLTKTYQVGDYYNENGKEGVVFEVSADGLHGKIVSMTQSRERLQWSSDEAEQKRLIGADSKTDGAYNMAKVKAVANWQEKYPAFKCCADLGEDWYLPSIEELKKFTLDDAVHDAVNCTLTSKGGVKLFNRGDEFRWYWSSTEHNEQCLGMFCAWHVLMNDGYTYLDDKYSIIYVRAVSAF